MNIYRAKYATAAVVPNPRWAEHDHLILANNEQDVRDSLNPIKTGVVGAMFDVHSVELVGEVAYTVDEKAKQHWDGDR